MNDELLEDYRNGHCTMCHRKMLRPVGKPNAPILMIGHTYDEEELRKGVAWCGQGAKILRNELLRAGIDMSYVRLTNMWLHEETEDCDKQDHLDILMWEISQQKPRAIMIMGTEPSQFFTGHSISLLSGLEVKSPYVNPELLMAMMSPGLAIHDTLGEIRLAVEKFAYKVKPILGKETLYG